MNKKLNDELLKSAWEGNLETVQATVERGADVNIVAEYGWTPLMGAAYGGHFNVVRFLAGEKRADLNFIAKDEWTALKAAKLGESPEIINYLEAMGAE